MEDVIDPLVKYVMNPKRGASWWVAADIGAGRNQRPIECFAQSVGQRMCGNTYREGFVITG